VIAWLSTTATSITSTTEISATSDLLLFRVPAFRPARAYGRRKAPERRLLVRRPVRNEQTLWAPVAGRSTHR
jgi:hypothetical protein